MSSKNFVSALETNLYMQNQLLKDSDFMSMWHSVELRVPFLDKDLMKFIFSIDEKIKFKNNIPKFLLKESFNDIVPSEIVKRPKMGFTFPFQEWMRNNLKLFSSDIVTNGDINSKHAKDLLHKFEVGKLHWSRLWALIVLNRWSI
jgi:asparagine synthase (glutamine-hydrolysing)